MTDTTAPALVAMGLVRGTLVHLVREGEQRTLCGKHHRVNTRYVYARFDNTLPAEEATCKACLTLATGYTVEKNEYEVPCDHMACDVMHRHLYNSDYAERTLVTLYNMDGEAIGTRWEHRFHMAQRTEWVVLLHGVRVGDSHDTKREAEAQAATRPTI